MMPTPYTVKAVPWEHGLELHIEGIGITQAHDLTDAARMAADLIARRTGVDPASVVVLIQLDEGETE
jgi:hypothetical protein